MSGDVGAAIAVAATLFSTLVALVTTGAVVPDSSLAHRSARRWWWVSPTISVVCSSVASLVAPVAIASLLFLASAATAAVGTLLRPAYIGRSAARERHAKDLDDRPAVRNLAVAVAVGLQLAGVVVLFSRFDGA